MVKIAAFIAGVFGLSACGTTHLEARPDGKGPFSLIDDKTIVRAGAVYAVPMLQFKLATKRTLTQCIAENGTVDIQFAFKLTAEPHYVAGEHFVLDYQALSSWTKTSSIEMSTYDNGVIKSINGQAVDQSAAIIGDVVSSGVSIARLAAGVPGVKTNASPLGHGITPPPTQMTFACKPETIEILNALKTSTTVLKLKTKELSMLVDEMAQLERAAILGAITDTSKGRLEMLGPLTKAKAKEVAEASESVSTYGDRLSVEEQILWPTDPTETLHKASPNPESSEKLSNLFLSQQVLDGVTEAELKQSTILWLTLVPSTVTVKDKCAGKAACEKEDQFSTDSVGVFYRNPVPAQLIACHVSSAASCLPSGASSVQVSTSILAPQLGPLRVLRLANGPFQNNELSASFRQDGSLAIVKYEEKAARGKVLSASVASALTAAVAFRDANESYKAQRRKADEDEMAARDKAKLDKLDQEISLLNKQKTLANLQKPVNPSIEADNADLAQINARIALLEARRRQRGAEKALADLEDEAP